MKPTRRKRKAARAKGLRAWRITQWVAAWAARHRARVSRMPGDEMHRILASLLP